MLKRYGWVNDDHVRTGKKKKKKETKKKKKKINNI